MHRPSIGTSLSSIYLCCITYPLIRVLSLWKEVVVLCDISYYSMFLPALQILADKDAQPLING